MIVVSRQEYEGVKETIALVDRPANVRRLRSALAQAKVGKLKECDL
jgi:PHD/YefM family antitoxin component YafN of YafNO toxin-antitoxin module